MGNLVLHNTIDNQSLEETFDQPMKADNSCLVQYKLEDLIADEVLHTVFRPTEEFKNKSAKDLFNGFEFQENIDNEKHWRQNMIKELNELHTTGLQTTEFYLQDLKKTRFQEHFRVVENGKDQVGEMNNTQRSYRMQHMKFMLMYKYFQSYSQEGQEQSEHFLDRLADKLEKTKDAGMNLYGSELNISIIFKLLDNLKQAAPEVLEEALVKIYHTTTALSMHTRASQPGTNGHLGGASFQKGTQSIASGHFQFYAREEILDEHRNYLVELVNDDTTQQNVKEVALRLIIVIGNLRSSGEDYLVAYNLISRHQLKVNLNAELSMNPGFWQISNSLNPSTQSFRINDIKSTKVVVLQGIDHKVSQNQNTSIAFDEQYVYLDVVDKGLYKIGLQDSVHVTPGIEYCFNSDLCSSKKRSLVCIQDQIYLRDEQNQSQEPFILIDRISLSKLETTEDKIKQIRNKRSFISDDWNKQFLEITDQEAFEVEFAKGTLSEYRSVSYTPVFTDSQSIYIIATYCKSSSSENRT